MTQEILDMLDSLDSADLRILARAIVELADKKFHEERDLPF